MVEREMEDLIAQYPQEFFPRKTLILRGRQESFAGVGRFDLFFEDEHQTRILMELKARAAKYVDADQLAKYKDVLEKQGERNVLMWLVAPDIPNAVKQFLDRIGIEYTEIHEPEFRQVASRHNYLFSSEATRPAELTSLTTKQIASSPTQREGEKGPTWSFGKSARSDGGESEFLERCDDEGKVFFSALFNSLKSMTRKVRITWNHESGFSLQFTFERLGFVEMLWGFPARNRDGKSRKESLVFPFDFASRRGVSEDFINDFATALDAVTPLSQAAKRPRIPISNMTEADSHKVLKTILDFAEKAPGYSRS